MKTTAIYARCSSEESAVKGLSIKDQVERCEQKAKELNLEVLEVFRDEGFSAGVESRVTRPAFEEMIAKAKTGNFDHIICLDTSRFSRDPVEAELFERALDRDGVRLIYVHLPDIGPFSEVVRQIFRAMDRFHSISSKVKARQGMEQIIKQGYRAGGPAPYGYKLKKHEFGIKPDGSTYYRSTLEPDHAPSGDINGKSRSQAIVEYFERRTQGEGRKSIARDFDKRGIKTLKGKPWNPSTFVSMEDNLDVYLGHTVWNRTRRGYPEKDEKDFVRMEDTHPALISKETAEAIRSRRRKNTWRKVKHNYALSGGFLKCGHCGSTFFGSQGFYRCSGRSYRGKEHCPNESIKASTFEESLLELIQSIYDGDALEGLVQKHLEKQKESSRDIKKLEKEIGVIEGKMERWEEAYALKAIDITQFMEKNVPLKNQRNEILEQIRRNKAYGLGTAQIRALVKSYVTALPENPKALNRFIGGLTLYPKTGDRRKLDLQLAISLPRAKQDKLSKAMVAVRGIEPFNSLMIHLELQYQSARRYIIRRN